MALSLDIEPTKVRFSPHGWMAGPGSFLTEEGEDFDQRMRMASRALNHGIDAAWLVMGEPARCGVDLAQFSAWVGTVGLSMPVELQEMARPAETLPPTAPKAAASAAVPDELRHLLQTGPRDIEPAAPTAGAAHDCAPAARPLTPRELATAFDGLGRSMSEWLRVLGDTRNHKWTLPARVTTGARGKDASTWNPAAFAALLEERGLVPRFKLKQRFKADPALTEWRAAWGRYVADREA